MRIFQTEQRESRVRQTHHREAISLENYWTLAPQPVDITPDSCLLASDYFHFNNNMAVRIIIWFTHEQEHPLAGG